MLRGLRCLLILHAGHRGAVSWSGSGRVPAWSRSSRRAEGPAASRRAFENGIGFNYLQLEELPLGSSIVPIACAELATLVLVTDGYGQGHRPQSLLPAAGQSLRGHC